MLSRTSAAGALQGLPASASYRRILRANAGPQLAPRGPAYAPHSCSRKSPRGAAARQRSVVVQAGRKVETTIRPSSEPAVQEMMEFLKEDLPHLFDDQGIDESKYGEVVDFQDPITKYDTLSGYLFNIKMLRAVFNPEFILHGIWQSGPNEITSRWTMNMEVSVNRFSPFRKFWDPKLTFTGLSIYTMDDISGKIIKHLDYWDAIEDQKYLSIEGVTHLFSQVADFTQTPKELKGPEYVILKKKDDYEIREYYPFVVAEKKFTDGEAVPSNDERKGAFQTLAKYIFGANEKKAKMNMTTPVISDNSTMQFVIADFQEMEDIPPPEDKSVSIKKQQGGIYAALTFNGVATEEIAQDKQVQLRKLLSDDSLSPGFGFLTARYNDPSVSAAFRRNEVLVPLEDFTLLEADQ